MFDVRRQKRPLLEGAMRDLLDVREDSVLLDLYGLRLGWRSSEVEGEVRE
jgi:hypothetical protein